MSEQIPPPLSVDPTVNGYHSANGHSQTAVPPVSLSEMINSASQALTPQPSVTPERDNARFRRILTFFAAIILHVIWWDLLVGRIPLIGDWVRSNRTNRFRRWAARFRVLAINMGGVMIKLGQFLSVRVDVLPPEIIDELMGLQDEVPPETTADILAVIEQELGPLTKTFAHFETEHLAAASLGQTHRAWLHPQNGRSERGDAVVIKVQRPGIDRIVQTDLAALRIVARWIMRYKPIRRRANVPALMEEFAETLWEELDYRAEVENTDRFAELFANNEQIYTPAVYKQLSTGRVIVMENVESIKITDVDQMKALDISPKAVADALLASYFEQIFKAGFFHADPHPGNIFVRPRPDIPWPPADEQGSKGKRPFWLIFIDFGMMGRVPAIQGKLLRQLLLSVTQQDAAGLTEAYNELGFFLPGADLERINEAQSAVLERIYGRNLLELARPDPAEIEELGQEFRDLLFDFPLQIPQDFIYLGRATSMVSGLVSQLDDNINPWYFIELFGQELAQEQVKESFNFQTLSDLLRPYWSTPGRVQRIIQAAEKGELKVRSIPDRETVRRQERLDKRLSQLSWSILGAAGMIAGSILYVFGRKKDEE